VGYLSTLLSPKYRSSRQKLNQDMLELHDLADISRPFHPNTKEYTFFPATHGTFPPNPPQIETQRLKRDFKS
jgi:exonuclease III